MRTIRSLTTALLPAALLATLAAATAGAHHSGSMFDQTKQVTLTGTVREFQWTNPHSWIQLMVPGDDGTPVEWSIEMAAPSGLYRQGWRQSTLKPGDSIVVVINPVRDGGKAGNFVSGTRADGTMLGRKSEGTP